MMVVEKGLQLKFTFSLFSFTLFIVFHFCSFWKEFEKNIFFCVNSNSCCLSICVFGLFNLFNWTYRGLGKKQMKKMNLILQANQNGKIFSLLKELTVWTWNLGSETWKRSTWGLMFWHAHWKLKSNKKVKKKNCPICLKLKMTRNLLKEKHKNYLNLGKNWVESNLDQLKLRKHKRKF